MFSNLHTDQTGKYLLLKLYVTIDKHFTTKCGIMFYVKFASIYASFRLLTGNFNSLLQRYR